jgi:hypothetical protein
MLTRFFASHQTLSPSVVGHLDRVVDVEEDEESMMLVGWVLDVQRGARRCVRFVTDPMSIISSSSSSKEEEEELTEQPIETRMLDVARPDVAEAYSSSSRHLLLCGFHQKVRWPARFATGWLETTADDGEGWTRFLAVRRPPPPVFLRLARFSDRAQLRARFLSAEPFHHLVLDDFLDAAQLAAAEQELRVLPEAQWHDPGSPDAFINDEGDSPVQSKKVALTNPRRMPPLARRALQELQSPAFLRFLSDVTGVGGADDAHSGGPLLPDPVQFGAGVHRVQQGGHLSLHADFNVHRGSGLHRRLNVLVYLNSHWRPEHEGKLELWGGFGGQERQRRAHVLSPLFNRLVLFRITDDAVHGHPTRWQSPAPRLSLALYYYTADRPAHEKTPAHYGATWYPAPPVFEQQEEEEDQVV